MAFAACSGAQTLLASNRPRILRDFAFKSPQSITRPEDWASQIDDVRLFEIPYESENCHSSSRLCFRQLSNPKIVVNSDSTSLICPVNFIPSLNFRKNSLFSSLFMRRPTQAKFLAELEIHAGAKKVPKKSKKTKLGKSVLQGKLGALSRKKRAKCLKNVSEGPIFHILRTANLKGSG